MPSLPEGLDKQIAQALNISDDFELGVVMRYLQSDLDDGRLNMNSDFVQAARQALARYKKRDEGLKELVRQSEELGLYDEELPQLKQQKDIKNK